MGMESWQCGNVSTWRRVAPMAQDDPERSTQLANHVRWKTTLSDILCILKVVFFHVFSISEWPGQSGSPITHIAWWNDERIWSSQGALEIFKAPRLVPGLVGDHGTILCRLPRWILPWFGYPNYMDVSPEIQELASGKLTVCYWKWP